MLQFNIILLLCINFTYSTVLNKNVEKDTIPVEFAAKDNVEIFGEDFDEALSSKSSHEVKNLYRNDKDIYLQKASDPNTHGKNSDFKVPGIDFDDLDDSEKDNNDNEASVEEVLEIEAEDDEYGDASVENDYDNDNEDFDYYYEDFNDYDFGIDFECWKKYNVTNYDEYCDYWDDFYSNWDYENFTDLPDYPDCVNYDYDYESLYPYDYQYYPYDYYNYYEYNYPYDEGYYGYPYFDYYNYDYDDLNNYPYYYGDYHDYDFPYDYDGYYHYDSYSNIHDCKPVFEDTSTMLNQSQVQNFCEDYLSNNSSNVTVSQLNSESDVIYQIGSNKTFVDIDENGNYQEFLHLGLAVHKEMFETFIANSQRSKDARLNKVNADKDELRKIQKQIRKEKRIEDKKERRKELKQQKKQGKSKDKKKASEKAKKKRQKQRQSERKQKKDQSAKSKNVDIKSRFRREVRRRNSEKVLGHGDRKFKGRTNRIRVSKPKPPEKNEDKNDNMNNGVNNAERDNTLMRIPGKRSRLRKSKSQKTDTKKEEKEIKRRPVPIRKDIKRVSNYGNRKETPTERNNLKNINLKRNRYPKKNSPTSNPIRTNIKNPRERNIVESNNRRRQMRTRKGAADVQRQLTPRVAKMRNILSRRRLDSNGNTPGKQAAARKRIRKKSKKETKKKNKEKETKSTDDSLEFKKVILEHDGKNAPATPFRVSKGCECGKVFSDPRPRVINGDKAEPNEFPFMVSIQILPQKIHFCGGTLITQYHVLTAAHCTIGLFPEDMRLVLGEHDLSDKRETSTKIVFVTEILEHFKYNDNLLDNDISLITMSLKVRFTPDISPICLTPADYKFFGEEVTSMGWGVTKEGKRKASKVLRKVKLLQMSMNDCRYSFSTDPYPITNAMFCADGDDVDVCQGDSGGPIVYYDEEHERYIQTGIVSWGFGCNHKKYPGVYTKLSVFIEWIYDNTWWADYCSSFEPEPDKVKKKRNF